MSIALEYARKQVAATLEEIDRLKQSEFPYSHSRGALILLEERFKKYESLFKKIQQPTTAATYNACSSLWNELYICLPILGFILRSTNVRNAFEAYAPLLRLARQILGPDTKLIVSSEWAFSPFIYKTKSSVLSDFVLIGLPASESSNPLLVSLASHEFGHMVWEKENCPKKYERIIKDAVLKELLQNRWSEYNALYPQYKKQDFEENLLAPATWRQAYTLALLQTEEMFCDFFGLQIFAESYFHAFAYVVCPGTAGERLLCYPTIARRVLHLKNAANAMNIQIPVDFGTEVLSESEPQDSATKLLVSIADTVSSALESDLIKLAQNIAAQKNVALRSSLNVKKIRKEFKHNITPTSEHYSIVDIVNAGWNCILDVELWKNVPQIGFDEKDRILKDLMLKSMEVSEIHERLKANLRPPDLALEKERNEEIR